jgi:hypothetical protein
MMYRRFDLGRFGGITTCFNPKELGQIQLALEFCVQHPYMMFQFALLGFSLEVYLDDLHEMTRDDE